MLLCVQLHTYLREGKGEPHPRTDLGARCGWVVKDTPQPLYSSERDLAPIVQEAGWAPGPLWTDAEHLAPTGIRTPYRPARSASLYRLSYRGLPKAAVLFSAWFFKVKCNREDSIMNFLNPILFDGTKYYIYIHKHTYIHKTTFLVSNSPQQCGHKSYFEVCLRLSCGASIQSVC